MPMMYADNARHVRAIRRRNSVEGILDSLGLRDPVRAYEPDMTDAQVYAKYAGAVAGDTDAILRIPSSSAQRDLMAKLQPLLVLKNDLASVFLPGAIPGAKDHDKLGTLVLGSRNLDRDIRAARAKYGVSAPQALAPVASPSASTKGGGEGGGDMTVPLAIAAILAAVALAG